MAKSILFILQIQEPERTREVTLKKGITRIGREPGNEIQLNYPKVSRKHARIECTDTMCMIFDEESANGIVVDGQRIQPHVPTPLNDSSVVEIDPVRMICKHMVEEKPDESPVEEPPLPEDQTVSRKKAQETEEQEEKTAEKIEIDQPEEEKPPKKEKVVEEKGPDVPAGEPPLKPPKPPGEEEPEPKWTPPPGLSEHSIRYLDYLPGIYHNNFMSHFMALFESILIPVEWNVDNFDLFLQPGTAPVQFLGWLSSWWDLLFDSSWTEEKRRLLLEEAHQIYARRGTRWALTRLLEIYTDQTPEITEFEKDMDPHTFKVVLKESKYIKKDLVTRLIDANKPAHTSYQLAFKK